jgi:GT2 family glycosyltransferase
VTAPPVLPLVTVVVPMLDEERHIGACLASVLGQTYPAESIEVLVVDGGSRDGGARVVEDIAAHDARVRLLHNPRRIQTVAFNLAIRAGRGEYLALVSAHSSIPSDYLERCVRVIEESGADNVGGRVRAVGQGVVGRAIAAAWSSRVGVGGAAHHYATHDADAATAFPGFFRRSVFARVGCFDESLPIHEDYEMNWRIRAAGGRVRYSAAISTEYVVRGSLSRLARQYFGYGVGKATVALRHRGVMRPYHYVPPALVMALAATALTAPLSRGAGRALLALLAGYGAVIVVGTVEAGRGRGRAEHAVIPGALVTMHLAWGAGVLAGVASQLARRAARRGGQRSEVCTLTSRSAARSQE